MALTIIQKPLAEVVKGLSDKTPIGSKLRSHEWSNVPEQLAEDAFLSAGVESVRVLADAQAGLQKILTLARDANGAISMDRSKFIAEMQKTANSLGLRNTDPGKRGGLEDFGSERRSQMIFEQMIGQAQSKAYYLSGQDPDTLDAWPAQELVRLKQPKGGESAKRDWPARWKAAGGRFYGGRMIALKTDPIWVEISRFKRPWPPFDFSSGMGLDEIDRETSEALGLIAPGEIIEPSVERDLAAMRASVKGLPADMRAALKAAFGKQIDLTGDEAKWVSGEKLPPAKKPKAKPKAKSAPTPPPSEKSGLDDIVASIEPLREEALAIAAELKKARADRKTDARVVWAQIQDLVKRSAVIAEKSRAAVAIPVAQRGAVTFANEPPTKVASTVTSGAEICELYMHRDLVPKDITVLQIKGRAHYWNGSISLDPNDTASTVAHEITHHLETVHPEISAKSKAYLVKRAAGANLEPLRRITGKNYRPDEKAYRDEWVEKGGDAYSGKWYDSPHTELLTMGIERLHQNPALFLAEDPDYFKFVVNTLRKW